MESPHLRRLVLVVGGEAGAIYHRHDETVGHQCQRRDGGEHYELVFGSLERVASGNHLTGHHTRDSHDAAGCERGRGGQEPQPNRGDDGRARRLPSGGVQREHRIDLVAALVHALVEPAQPDRQRGDCVAQQRAGERHDELRQRFLGGQ